MKVVEKIPSRLESVPSIINKFLQVVEPFVTDEEKVFQLKLALSEAVINAIKHGNKFNAVLSVNVDIEVSAEKVSLTVEDEGEGFDFRELADPTKQENLEKNCGRGVFLIKKLMDEVIFSEGGRVIKMTKFLQKGGKR